MYLPVFLCPGAVFSATETLWLDGQLEQNGVHPPQTDESDSWRVGGSNDQNTWGTLRWRKCVKVPEKKKNNGRNNKLSASFCFYTISWWRKWCQNDFLPSTFIIFTAFHFRIPLPAATEFHLLGLNVSYLPVNNVTLETLEKSMRAKFLTFASFIFGSLAFSYITCCVLDFAACSNEKCRAGESQRLIIFLLLEFMRCIWGQLLPVCASAFLSAQCELSQRGEEGTPGRLLPPHQTCPLPLSVSPSFLPNDSHTAWVVLLPLFFFSLLLLLFILSLLRTISPSDTDSLLDARMCAKTQLRRRM